MRALLTRSRTAVFAATETWLNSSIGDGEIAVPGFNVVRRDRDQTGGGVALFIRNDISFNPRPDLSVHLEALWVEILLPETKGILVGVVYRPPNDGEFLSKLEQSLAKIDPGKEVFIFGDMNIDLGQSTNSLVSRYKGILDLFGLKQLVSEPTRITQNSSTIIDHVLVKLSILWIKWVDLVF